MNDRYAPPSRPFQVRCLLPKADVSYAIYEGYPIVLESVFESRPEYTAECRAKIAFSKTIKMIADFGALR